MQQMTDIVGSPPAGTGVRHGTLYLSHSTQIDPPFPPVGSDPRMCHTPPPWPQYGINQISSELTLQALK